MSRPCKLQINSKGAWRDVLNFDLDVVDAEALQHAAADAFQHALVRWDAKKGWVDA